MKTLPLPLVFIFLALGLRAAAPHPAVVRAELINRGASYPECHASTIVETAPGQLVAAWFGGTKERNPDVCIYVARFESGHWTPGVMVADGVQPEGSPAFQHGIQFFSRRKMRPCSFFIKLGPHRATGGAC